MLLFSAAAFRVVVVLAGLAVPLAHAGQIWVDAKSPAGGGGSAQKPFLTIQQAARSADAGDTVHVRPGVYRERVMPEHGGEPGKPIVYVSEVLHGAVIKGSDTWAPAWRDEGAGLYSGELNETLFADTQYMDGGNAYRIRCYFEQERNRRPPYPHTNVNWTLGQVILDDEPLPETSSREELTKTRHGWWFDPAANRILVNLGSERPQGRVFEITTRRGVFRPRVKGLGYVELRGFVFAHCANQFPGQFWAKPENAQSGMVGTRSGHHWVIASNVFQHAKSIGLTFGNSGSNPWDGRAYDNETPAQPDPPSNTIGFHRIEGNVFLGNGALGAMGFQHTGVELRNNLFLGNNRLLNTSYETGGIKTHAAHQMLVADNWFIDNDCMGVWLDNTWKNCRVTRNVFMGNRGKNLFFEMDNNTPDTASLVDHNLFLPGRPELPVAGKGEPGKQPWQPWSVGVYGHDADGVRITRNLFASEGYGIYFRKITNRKGGAAHISTSGNIFAGTNLTAVCLPLETPPLVQGNRFEANVYPVATRSFAATGWSLATGGADKASILRILELAGSPSTQASPFGDPAKSPSGYYLSLEQWRKVMNFDHVSLAAGVACTFDRNTWTLSLDIPSSALQVNLPPESGLDTDFLGQPVSIPARPGPFGALKPGLQRIQLSAPEYLRRMHSK